MSMPNIPDVNPKIKLKRKDVINLLLASIALEEIGISHIINAEAEKLQKAIHKSVCLGELLEVNKSVNQTLRTLIKKEMLLHMKLEDVLRIPDFACCPCPPCECDDDCICDCTCECYCHTDLDEDWEGEEAEAEEDTEDPSI